MKNAHPYKNKNRRGQIIGQVFIYIMTAIMIGAIVLIGYWALDMISDKRCQAESISFNTRMESLIERYDSYGSLEKDNVIAPCGFHTVCFTDASKIGTTLRDCRYGIINNTLKDGVKNNIFLINDEMTVPAGYSPKISLANPDDCTCITVRNSNFFITFRGKGSSTEISATT